MGMPVYSKLGLLTGDTKYSNWMYEMYNHTKSALGGPGLYDTEDGLWYRDTKYIYPNGSHAKSSNGKKVYWSRGDGWVIGALVKVLQDLPDSDPHREEYESMFKIMAEALIKRQGNDGFWRRNLGDYDELPQPETSGTAFFTYAFSWGVNNGLLDKDTYMPAIIKAFNGMHATAIHPTGRVGRVQPIGENPAPTQDIGYAQTQDFGVGAVLLMLAELSKMESGIVNTDLQPMLEKNMVSTVGIKVGSNKILVGTAYKGEACHVQEIENAPIKEDGIIFVSKDFAVEQLNYTPTETIIRDSVEYASLESIAKALGKELFINGDIIVVCHQKSLFMPERDQNLLSLLDAVLTNGEFPERPKYENRFEYILPPAPKNLVPVTTVTASASPEAENVPSNVLDRNLGTRWSAESTTEEGQWIKLDFNKAIINKVGIAFHLGTQRATSYKVEVLTSAGNWVAVREKENSSGISSSYEYLEFEPVEATSVRITGYGNTVNKWSSITDVEVLATEDYSTGTWYPYFSTANWMTMDLGVGNTGNQTIEFNIQPSEAKQDGAIYYTGYDTVLDTWADAPIAVRLNTNGYFDARNGGSYAAANQIAYEANKTYKVKIMVDINAKKYSVYITGPEGNLQTLAVDYAFRLDAQAITDIGKMCARGGNGVTAGKFVILDHKISRGTTPIETYTVDLDANGGTVVPESLIVEAGSTANLPTPSRSGYKFEGWFTAATGGTKVTDQTSITSNMKLYARWTENSGDGWEPYTSTADWSTVDLGSGHTGNQVIEFTIRPLEDNQDGAIYYTGQNSLLSAWGHAPIAVRLTPSGYFDARNGGAFAATNQIKYEANKTYKVRLEVNVTSKIYNVYITDDTGKEQILAAGFVFRTGAETVTDIGKICARGGNGVAAGKFIIETHEIKAGNEPEVFYTVNFNANGGNVSQNSVLVKSGATLELPVPTRSNYEFTGWYTERTGGTEVRNDTVITADMTIYARWQAQAPETYMVIFDANGGSVDPAQMTVEAGRTIQLPSPVQGG